MLINIYDILTAVIFAALLSFAVFTTSKRVDAETRNHEREALTAIVTLED